ncbi:MAG TPA: phosphatase PAP2 family protein [Gammaproteobacteria bacterium]|nr:phosphatase PAP2 family protein [Gammaproteobacteria bacterium]
MPLSSASAHTYTSASDLPPPKHPTDYERNWASNLADDIKHDVGNYASSNNLLFFGGAFLGAGVLANTGLDRAFADHYQTDFKTKGTDSVFALPKAVGGLSYYFVPIFLTSVAVGHLREHTLLGNVLYHWGYRSFRTILLGGAQQIAFTHLLGSGRPNLKQDSKWQPFRYPTGVSGHAFYGAIPFLTAAMMSDPPLLKYGLYTISTLPGLSRVNDDKHYLSQVILGWSIAFLSARSIYQTDLDRDPTFQVGVYPRSGGAMLSGHTRF